MCCAVLSVGVTWKAQNQAAVLLAAGQKGHRYTFPHAKISTAPPVMNRVFGQTVDAQLQVGVVFFLGGYQGGRTPTGWPHTAQSGEPDCRGPEAEPHQRDAPNTPIPGRAQCPGRGLPWLLSMYDCQGACRACERGGSMVPAGAVSHALPLNSAECLALRVI